MGDSDNVFLIVRGGSCDVTVIDSSRRKAMRKLRKLFPFLARYKLTDLSRAVAIINRSGVGRVRLGSDSVFRTRRRAA
jgi:hypothetical protein